jgi:CheY-like chemotaxis protein
MFSKTQASGESLLPIEETQKFPKEHIEGTKIILVEDNVGVRKTFIRILTNYGYPIDQITEVDSGDSFLQDYARTLANAVIILDDGLPGTSGCQVINELPDIFFSEKNNKIIMSTGRSLSDIDKNILSNRKNNYQGIAKETIAKAELGGVSQFVKTVATQLSLIDQVRIIARFQSWQKKDPVAQSPVVEELPTADSPVDYSSLDSALQPQYNEILKLLNEQAVKRLRLSEEHWAQLGLEQSLLAMFRQTPQLEVIVDNIGEKKQPYSEAYLTLRHAFDSTVSSHPKWVNHLLLTIKKQACNMPDVVIQGKKITFQEALSLLEKRFAQYNKILGASSRQRVPLFQIMCGLRSVLFVNKKATQPFFSLLVESELYRDYNEDIPKDRLLITTSVGTRLKSTVENFIRQEAASATN